MTIDILSKLRQIEILLDDLRLEIRSAQSAETLIPDNLITLGRAAQLARTNLQNIRRWTVRHELGEKIGGRWMVDRDKLARYLNRSSD